MDELKTLKEDILALLQAKRITKEQEKEWDENYSKYPYDDDHMYAYGQDAGIEMAINEINDYFKEYYNI